MAPPSPDWQPVCSHCFEGENFLTYSHSFYFFFPSSPLIPNSKCFLCFCISLSFCRHVCDGLCAYWWVRLNVFGVCVHEPVGACVNICKCVVIAAVPGQIYRRKSVDRRHSSLIAWLINQVHWLHMDLGLLSEGLLQGPLWAHNDSLAHGVRASSGL